MDLNVEILQNSYQMVNPSHANKHHSLKKYFHESYIKFTSMALFATVCHLQHCNVFLFHLSFKILLTISSQQKILETGVITYFRCYVFEFDDILIIHAVWKIRGPKSLDQIRIFQNMQGDGERGPHGSSFVANNADVFFSH